MKIEERVLAAISAAAEKNFSAAMADICPAVEATARKKLCKRNIGRSEYKSFLRNYYFIIEPFIGVGINLAETKFPHLTLDTDGGEVIESPDFAEIIYHAFRCSLAHGHEIDEKFRFTTSPEQGRSYWIFNLEKGRIHMPDKTVWALIAVVIFCDANKDIDTETQSYLTWGGANVRAGGDPYRFDVDVFWGAEETIRRFLDKCDRIRVDLKLT